MVSGRILADYQELLPNHMILNYTDWQAISAGGKPVLLVPRGDDTVNWLGRPQLMQASLTGDIYKTVSSDLHFKALAQNKAYQHFMAVQASMGDMFPATAILPTLYAEAEGTIVQMGGRSDNDLVLKPVSEYGGTGLRLIKADRAAAPQVKKHLNILKFSLWPGIRDPICLLQERVEPNPVTKDNATFDGTMRVVFSVYGAGDALECRVHDAYWKLPSHAMGDGAGVDDFISFSPSNSERKTRKKPKARKSIKDEYNEFMASLGLEDYGVKEEEPSFERIHSQGVSPDIKEWLFPAFGGDMSRYFSHVASIDHEASVSSLVSQDDPTLQGLGWMMAVNYDYYPPANGQISMNYPISLREAIADSSMVHSTENYMHFKLKMALDTMHGTSINCENIGRDFVRPLEKAISRRRQSTFMGSLFDTVYKMSR